MLSDVGEYPAADSCAARTSAAVAVLLDAASAATFAGVELRLTGAQTLVRRVLAASGLGALIA